MNDCPSPKFQKLLKSVASYFLTLLVITLPVKLLAGAKLSATQKKSAAKLAVITNPSCQKIQPFYWEIGDANQVLVSGTTGNGKVKRTTSFPIASASKWVSASYALQKLNGVLDETTQNELRMTSGYTNLVSFSCIFSGTLNDCWTKQQNSQLTSAHVGKFFYNGGHLQKWGMDHDLGFFARPQMVGEFQKYLGSDFKFSFGAMQLAGGMNTSAQSYAAFLMNILRGNLVMLKYLGANPTCTLPKKCPTSVYSPIPEEWHYSYGHWVEDSPSGDGAFSSPGAFGFYPWIDASKKIYGVISRQQRLIREDKENGAGFASAKCGQAIRKAYSTGSAN